MAKVSVISTQIFANTASSGAVDLGSHALVALEMPEVFNGTTITFQAKAKRTEDLNPPVGSHGGEAVEDWDDVYDSAGNQISWTVAANRMVVPTAAHAAALAPLRFIRIVANTGQGETREFRFIVKEGQ